MVLAIEAYNATVVTEDRLEGVRAFNERRKPRSRGAEGRAMTSMPVTLTDEQRALEGRRGRDLQALSGRVLAAARPGARLPRGVRHELTRAGYLAALIPPEYGGAGLGILEGGLILETINACGGNAAACHAQMYIMGTVLRHGSRGPEAALSAEDRLRRAPPAGLRRDGAELRLRHDAAPDHRGPARATATSSTARRSSSRGCCSPT